ncbi:MAG: hypothetical protein GEU92_13515 [Alphaproteobacteria bacterium]|nr:hypothetical protein [Alphaproteobacteria bacterium]
MAVIRTHVLVISAAAFLAGCSFTTDALWPSLSGEDPKANGQPARPAQQRAEIPPSAGEIQSMDAADAPPHLGSTNFVPPQVTPGTPTGTFVGQKVGMLRGELQRMQAEIGQQNQQLQGIRRETSGHSQGYHSTIATINSRLQVGTTPGNPVLVQQWNAAQSQLARIDGDIAQMNSLANNVAGSSTMSSYLLETTRAAYGLSGAIEEDHRQLAILEDEVNRTVVLIERLLNELSEDINRQTTYVSNERANLTALSLAIKNGELMGSSLASRGLYSGAGAAASDPQLASRAGPVANGATRRPLVVIRFDRANVEYKQALYNAVNQALQRRPQSGFDLVAVAPNQGSPAQVSVASNRSKRNAEDVLRSLSEMGLPLDRVRLSAMVSNQADSNEVHIYVR